ncbi:hypothetical protein MMC19_003674 [Ptychographa xylographoides]|nr:hypothetical protein [Ptychographa xylographoides]
MTKMPASMATSGMMDSSAMDGMPMTFNSNNFTAALFASSWMPTTPAAYAGTWIFLFFLAIIWRALVRTSARLDRYWARKHEEYAILIDGGKERATREKTVAVWRWSVNLPRATLATVNQGIAYLLMIAVMTMNTGFFLAVLVGYFIGELCFGRISGASIGKRN